MRSTNVLILQNPGIGPCRVIPLEQLAKMTRESKQNRMNLQVAATFPRGWSSDYMVVGGSVG